MAKPQNTDEPVQVGIVGLGHNGMAHLRAHMTSDASEIVAVYDRNRDLVEQACREFEIPKQYTDDSFYDDPDIEAVSIHTGENDHKDPFVKAVEAGKHVLVEKPLASTEEDVHEMVEAATSADPELKIQVGYILRFNPVFEEVHRRAAAGALGHIYYLEGDYIHNLLYQAEQTDLLTGRNWHLEHEIPLVGGGSHPLDILRWISGKEVCRAVGYSNHIAFPAMKHDDCQVCLFQFEDGTIAKVAALYGPRSAMAPFYNLRVYGTLGTVDRDTIAISSSPEDLHPEFKPVVAERVQGHPFLPEILDWLDAIRENRSPRIPIWDGANSTLATLVGVRAIRERREIDVPILKPRKDAGA